MSKSLEYYSEDGTHVIFDKYTIDVNGVVRNTKTQGVEYVWREETDDVIKFMARTTTGEKILIANKRNTPQDVKISLAFHADSSDSTVIHKTVDSSVLPAYSIAVL